MVDGERRHDSGLGIGRRMVRQLGGGAERSGFCGIQRRLVVRRREVQLQNVIFLRDDQKL